MRSAERRLTWAVVAGAVATGIAAPHTTAPLYNILIGLSWGVPIFIGVWAVLEGLTYLQETRDEAGNVKRQPSRSSNVYIMPRGSDEPRG